MFGEMRSAVVLLSGGLDSTTAAKVAVDALGAENVLALSFHYGQRHRVELGAASAVADRLGVRHRVLDASGLLFGSSPLTDPSVEVPKGREDDGGVAPTFVPGRNIVFLAVAAGLAEALGMDGVVCGVNAVDYSGYPDCRPEFVAAMATAVRFGLSRPVQVSAPLVRMSKAEIIQLAVAYGAPLELTSSCYSPVGLRACGACDSCRIRREGFETAGVPDPTRYA